MEKISNCLVPSLENINSYFTGQHDKIIQSSSNQEIQDFDHENDDRKFFLLKNFLDIIQKGNQKSDVTELDRLSYTVYKIDQECAVVPTEAFKSTPNGELIKNINFTGEKTGCFTIDSFKHFRNIPEEEKIRYSGNFEYFNFFFSENEK